MPEPADIALNAGGNPKAPKGEGDGPVQAYIAAMPDWKRTLGERIDAVITDCVPGVRKMVKWHTPFYGTQERGWFAAFYCYKRHLQVTFLNGAELQPPPPKASKTERARYLDLSEEDGLDEAQFRDWIVQASRLPGETL